MATVQSIEPSRTAKYPVYLGDSITSYDSRKRICMGIKYNHKPSQTTTSRQATITQSANSYKLTLEDDADTSYTYAGRRTHGGHTLIFDPERGAFILEKVGSEMEFNLTSAPWEKNAKELRSQYPQLNADDGDESDENNPYDYRNFLDNKKAPRTPRLDLADDELDNDVLTIEPQRGLGIDMKPKGREQPKLERKKKKAREEREEESPEVVGNGDLVIEMEPELGNARKFTPDPEPLNSLDIEMEAEGEPEPARGRARTTRDDVPVEHTLRRAEPKQPKKPVRRPRLVKEPAAVPVAQEEKVPEAHLKPDTIMDEDISEEDLEAELELEMEKQRQEEERLKATEEERRKAAEEESEEE
ncbi:MAG: hypothetical protein M1824_006412 [Vezdaea acicularis]|nr:MAG: hypothetical protein M1824_006412 [Vezdaea acicularis]